MYLGYFYTISYGIFHFVISITNLKIYLNSYLNDSSFHLVFTLIFNSSILIKEIYEKTLITGLLVLAGTAQAHEVWVQAPTKLTSGSVLKAELAYGDYPYVEKNS